MRVGRAAGEHRSHPYGICAHSHTCLCVPARVDGSIPCLLSISALHVFKAFALHAGACTWDSGALAV